MEMMWKVVSVSSCYCVMLCYLALAISVTVVSSCESEFVCRPCKPQRFISQTEEHSCSGNITPTSCGDNSTPTLPREGVTMWEFFVGRTGLLPILWCVEKTGVGLCTVEKESFSNKTEQPKLRYEMERRFYQLGMVVCPRRQVSLCLERTVGRRPEVLVSLAILFG